MVSAVPPFPLVGAEGDMPLGLVLRMGAHSLRLSAVTWPKDKKMERRPPIRRGQERLYD